MARRPVVRAMEAIETIWTFLVKFMAFTGVATWLLVGIIAFSVRRHK